MSIINDALKKTQQNFEHQKKIFTAGSGAPEPSKKFSDITGAIIIASFLASLLVLGVVFLFGPKEKKIVLSTTLTDSPLSLDASTPTTAAADPVVAPLAQSKAPDTRNHIAGLTLNGIVQMGEGYVALINNRILKEGDKIGDKKILGIYNDHVKVFDSGEIVILKRERF